MTFLELCKRTAAEAGVSHATPAPTTVVGQTGELQRIIEWVNSAYESIQNSHAIWKFLRFGFTVQTVVNQDAYVFSACTDTTLTTAIVNFGSWVRDSFKIFQVSVADEGEVPYMPYESWRLYYRMGTQVANRPQYATILPDDKIGLGPKPNLIYTFSGDYYRSPKKMAVDGDIPLMPAQYHMAIVWAALMLYAGHEEAGSLYTHAQEEHRKIYSALKLNQLPPIVMAGPLV